MNPDPKSRTQAARAVTVLTSEGHATVEHDLPDDSDEPAFASHKIRYEKLLGRKLDSLVSRVMEGMDERWELHDDQVRSDDDDPQDDERYRGRRAL